ncbi:hypothetical protein LWI29_003457 [Acer saccharum]|uniref:Uncharacterized protein n=1 Tax=Acer saccharum TaxID=4024 RepID=A0AA39TMD8_ACESA|nr:hypothetical protein LWI29_003457 [Acer saccharum]
MSSSSGKSTHILVIPYPASGHILPHIDLIHQLVIRGGLDITVLVTPKNVHFLNSLVSLHPTIETLVLPFPSHPNIPAGVENMQDVTIDSCADISIAFGQLCDPIIHWFRSHPCPPIAIFCDTLFNSWTHRLVSTLRIKTVGFMPTNAHFFLNCFSHLDSMPSFANETILKTKDNWGLLINSFTELEGDEKFNGIKGFMKHDKVWGVGPLIPIKAGDKERGGPSSVPVDELMAWLDSCQVDKSVVYVGFGSQIRLNRQQMEALGNALEKSGVRFVWAVKEPAVKNDHDHVVPLIPSGFEDRVVGRGLVIRGWIPQALILNHRAIGSYLTHFGWGSVLEGLIGGVLLLAWPMQVDHFSNATILVDQMGVAIRVCEGLTSVPDSENLMKIFTSSIKEDRPERIAWMKQREKALNAIKKGGSSYKAIDDFVTQLQSNLMID